VVQNIHYSVHMPECANVAYCQLGLEHKYTQLHCHTFLTVRLSDT